MKIFTFAFAAISLVSASSSTETSLLDSNSSTLISSSTSTSMDTSTSSTRSSISLLPSASVVVSLPNQTFFINIERPKMVNQINSQRSGMSHSLLCQDSLLSSIAQQHANDMAALDDLEHDLSCSTNAFPVQFCKSSDRLAPYGQAAENILVLAGNDGSAATAMAKSNADAAKFSNMMNPTYLYIGIGMAMNAVSGKYYWVQVFSAGDFQGVNCVLSPSVTVLDAFNRTTTTVQPTTGLNLGLYPRGISSGGNSVDKSSGKKKLFCTLIPFAHGTGTSVLPLGQLPYPTITLMPSGVDPEMKAKVSGVMKAFKSVLSVVNATSINPASISLFPMMQANSTTDSADSIDSTGSSSTATATTTSTSFTASISGSFNPASMLSSFTPTNAAQSSKLDAVSSMMANPTMASAMQQMAEFMMMGKSSSATYNE